MRGLAGIVAATLFALSQTSALAETSSKFFEDYSSYNEEGQAFLDKIEPKTGKIELPNGVLLDLKNEFYFLSKEDGVEVLTEAWGNPAQASVGSVGMLFSGKKSPLADSWGILLTNDLIGYVEDKDAATINYDELLQTMKSDTLDNNKLREEEGFEPITLIGWAAPPKYDEVNKRLYWAKELQFGTAEKRTLNYDVRFLGREGVFIMSYIATIDQLASVSQSLPAVLDSVSFAPGKRYADFVPGTDTVAAVGIGGLIAGKVAAKAGLLAVALVALKKFGFLLLVPVLWLWRLIRGRSAES